MTGVRYQGWEHHEKQEAIQWAIKWFKKGSTMPQVREITGLSQETLYRIAKEHGIEVEEDRWLLRDVIND